MCSGLKNAVSIRVLHAPVALSFAAFLFFFAAGTVLDAVAATPAGAVSPRSAAPSPSEWTIDKEHTHIEFAVAHFVISDTIGSFKDFDGQVSSPTDDFVGATAVFIAKIASLSTDHDARDRHLRSEEFFDAATYPELKFAGRLTKEKGKYVLKGDMTIRGITRPVSFDVIYGGRIKDRTFGIEKAGFKISGKINHLDFGLKWNETFEGGQPIVGAEVKIAINVEINKRRADVPPSS